ncbi:MAG: tyrosine-type recombinase/integrase [Silvanigrellaceae bacterium]
MRSPTPMPSMPLTPWLREHGSIEAVEIVEHFLLQFQSQHTRRNYASDLDSFFGWWNKKNAQLIENLEAITEKHVMLWLEQFSAGSNRSRKLATLSSFFRFCERKKFIPSNPCRLLKRKKEGSSGTTQALDEEETIRLLNHLHAAAFEFQLHGKHAERQRRSAQLRFAVIHTLFSVGMRVDELCELRVGDLLFHPPSFKIRFTSKGGEEHTTAVSESCATVIQNYLSMCRSGAVSGDFVFSRVQAASKVVKLSQTAVFRMIRESANEAGINKSLSPHSARATVATVLHRQGVPLGFIQTLLNHKQITTTAQYVKKANERSESAALKAPVSQWLDRTR